MRYRKREVVIRVTRQISREKVKAKGAAKVKYREQEAQLLTQNLVKYKKLDGENTITNTYKPAVIATAGLYNNLEVVA